MIYRLSLKRHALIANLQLFYIKPYNLSLFYLEILSGSIIIFHKSPSLPSTSLSFCKHLQDSLLIDPFSCPFCCLLESVLTAFFLDACLASVIHSLKQKGKSVITCDYFIIKMCIPDNGANKSMLIRSTVKVWGPIL